MDSESIVRIRTWDKGFNRCRADVSGTTNVDSWLLNSKGAEGRSSECTTDLAIAQRRATSNNGDDEHESNDESTYVTGHSV